MVAQQEREVSPSAGVGECADQLLPLNGHAGLDTEGVNASGVDGTQMAEHMSKGLMARQNKRAMSMRVVPLNRWGSDMQNLPSSSTADSSATTSRRPSSARPVLVSNGGSAEATATATAISDAAGLAVAEGGSTLRGNACSSSTRQDSSSILRQQSLGSAQPHTRNRPQTAGSQMDHTCQSSGHTSVLPQSHTSGAVINADVTSDHTFGHSKRSSLVAAAVLWNRTSGATFRPPLRQCLTYEEIAQLSDNIRV